MEALKIKKILKDKSGAGTIYAVGILMVFMLLLSFMMEYYRVRIVAVQVKNAFEQAILTTATENYNEIYAGIREKKMIGGEFDDEKEELDSELISTLWIDLQDYGNVDDELCELLNLIYTDGAFEKRIGEGGRNYALHSTEVYINDVISTGDKYEIKGKTKLEIPVYFAGSKIGNIDVTVHVKTAFRGKY